MKKLLLLVGGLLVSIAAWGDGLVSAVPTNYAPVLGVNTPTNVGAFDVTSTLTSTPDLVIHGVASQVAGYFRIVDSSGDFVRNSIPISSSDARAQDYWYNTLETTPTNYERGSIWFDNPNSLFRLETQVGGTGTQRPLCLQCTATSAAPLYFGSSSLPSSTGISGLTAGYVNGYFSAAVDTIGLSLVMNDSDLATGDITARFDNVFKVTASSISVSGTSVSSRVFPVIKTGLTDSSGGVGINILAERNAVGLPVSAGDDSGTFNNLWGALITLGNAQSLAGETPISNIVTGVEIDPVMQTGSMGAFYGIRVKPKAGSVTPTNYFGVSSEDTTAINRFAGPTRFGSTSTPLAWVDLAAGTATAGTAPLHFTSGVLLTTPVAGTMEYLAASGLFFTPASGTRQAVAYIDLAQTWTGTQTMTAALSTTSTAVTQTAGDNTTKPATDAFVIAAIAAGTAGTAPTTATATAGAATCNGTRCVVTTESLTTAALSSYTLTVTDSSIVANSIVGAASVNNGTNTTDGPQITTVAPTAGSVVIKVRNFNVTTAFNGTLKVTFLVQ